MQRQAEALDAIVVGSGISGGWAAKEGMALTARAAAFAVDELKRGNL